MGKCWSEPQSPKAGSKQHRESRSRLFGIFSRNVDQKRLETDKSYRNHERADNDEVTALQSNKGETSRPKAKSQNLYVDHDIDIYPISKNNLNGKSGLNEDFTRVQSDQEAKATMQNVSSQLLRQQILKGDVKTEIPNLAKIVKIVAASVHEDMTEERLILEGTIYPELRKFCRKHCFDFHIVDLSIDDEQFKYKDWMDEIEAAHSESTAIGFLVLVGQNFGRKLLPGKIYAKDFEWLLENLTSNHELLQKYYELDDTTETSCYVLKNIWHRNDDEMWEDSRTSELVIEEMEKKNFKENGEQPYVFNALLQVAALGHELTNKVSSALWVERTTSKEREIYEEENLEDKHELEIVRDTYRSKRTVISYEEFLTQNDAKRENFRRTVTETLKNKLLTAMLNPDVSSIIDENLKEVAQHTLICQKNLANVDDSQEHILNIQRSISSYLKKNTKLPLVVHGSPGSGKTTSVSMAAKLACDKTMVGTSLVVRFLGSTRHSSNLRFLLRSICFQLANGDTSLPEDFQSIVKMFHSLLHNATKTKRVWIILDGLDELPQASSINNLLWLPRELPDNVRIVLTVLTNGGCYNNLKAIVRDGNHFIDVGELEKNEARPILSSLCDRERIEPGPELTNRLLNAVYKCPNVLYLKLLLHHYHHKLPLVNATDYTGSHVPSSLKHVIEHFFTTMERKHGKSVIGRIMGCLSAARYGLSEHELEDVLSRDRISGQIPSSTQQFPTFQLARILHDLSPCLSKVYFDGVLVITWRHLIIRYLAFDKYLSHREDVMRSAYQTLTNYFVGHGFTIFSEADPLAVVRTIHDLPHYLYKIGNVEKLKHLALCNFNFLLAQLKGTCIDYVIECFAAKNCPMDSDIKTVLETLKMSYDALNVDPDQLAAQVIGRLSDLSSSDHISRLLKEARSSSSNALIPNTGCLNPPGTKLLHTCIELYGPVEITSDSTFGISATKNIIALWDVRSAKIIRSTTAESAVRSVCFCRHNRLFISDMGKYLQVWETSTFKKVWRLECPGKVEDITTAGDSQDMLAAACGSMVKCWSLRNGQMMTEITEEEMVFDRIAGWREYIACASSTAKDVRVYDIYTTSLVTHIRVYEKKAKDSVSCVLLSSFGDGQVLTTSDGSFEVRVFRLSNGEWLRTIGPDVVNPRLTSDGRYILCTNSRNDISIWSMETGVKITSVFRHPPTSIITTIVANDLTKVVTLSDNKILRVWDLEKEETIQQGLSQDKDDNCIRNVMFIKGKEEQRQAVSKSKVSGDICVWNLSNCKPVRILKGTQADDVLVVDETRAVLRSMGKLALIDLEEGRLIKKLRLAFPKMGRSRLERRASSLYKRRNLSLRLLQRSGVNSRAKCSQFTDVAIVGQKYVLVLASNRIILHLISLDDGELVTKLDSGHNECIETILVSANGKSLICSYDKDPAAAWDLDTRRVVGWLRVENSFPKLCQAAITRNGQFLVDAVKINDCAHIVSWNLETTEVQCKIPIPGTTVHAVAASSNSGTIVCSLKKEYRNTVMIYSLRSGSQLRSLPCGIRQNINNIHLSLDGQRVMTFATGDRTVKLWNTTKGTPIGSFTADHAISDCALSDDGNIVVMAIYKASTIASLSIANQRKSKEMSVDLDNPYYKPENYGAVFEFINILDWDDDTNHMDNTLAEKQ